MVRSTMIVAALIMVMAIMIEAKPSIIKKYNELKDDYIYLPVTFYTQYQVTAATSGNHGLLELHQCDTSTSGAQYVVVAIIIADNPNLNMSLGVPVVEISTVKGVFNSSTIIGVNYLWDVSTNTLEQAFNNITFRYPGNNQHIYIRYKAFNRATLITFQVSYTNYASIQIGGYNINAFKTVTETGDDDGAFSQFVRLNSVGAVETNSIQYYYFSLCSYEIPVTNSNYQITALASSQLSSPFSAMDILICAKSQVTNVGDCVTSNGFAVVNQCACSVAIATMENDDNIMSQGVYIGVLGEGAPPDGKNEYELVITAY